MLIKKNKKLRYSQKLQNYFKFIYPTPFFIRRSGLKKKKQQRNQTIIPENPLDPPSGNLFWFDPTLGKN